MIIARNILIELRQDRGSIGALRIIKAFSREGWGNYRIADLYNIHIVRVVALRNDPDELLAAAIELYEEQLAVRLLNKNTPAIILPLSTTKVASRNQ